MRTNRLFNTWYILSGYSRLHVFMFSKAVHTRDACVTLLGSHMLIKTERVYMLTES